MKYFGTDGIRDAVDGALLQPEWVERLGRAVGQWLKSIHSQKTSIHVLIGRDTRASGSDISLNLARGLFQEGIRIFDGGIAPTPAIAHCVKELGIEAGFVITASHNPASDNGIKLFSASGTKLTDTQETEIEKLIDSLPLNPCSDKQPNQFLFEARRHYLDAIKKQFAHLTLVGRKIVLDTANGATFQTTPELLEFLGATLIRIGDDPDGQNINRNVGSESTQAMQKAVVHNSADLGLAHDGDGDRLILCDHQGNIIDGDAVLAILGLSLARQNALPHRKVVSTIMSNAALDEVLASEKVQLIRSNVGDKNVYYDMIQHGAVLGGEASGHFISLQHASTGDGLIAALLILSELNRSDQSLQDLADVFKPYPQLKLNLPVKSKVDFDSVKGLINALNALEQSYQKKGRHLLRYSGTENKIRLLAEAKDPTVAQNILDDLKTIVDQFLS